jgi:hypothetical protein
MGLIPRSQQVNVLAEVPIGRLIDGSTIEQTFVGRRRSVDNRLPAMYSG